MKKIYILLLAMLSCVVSAHAQSTEGDLSTIVDKPVQYTVLDSSGGYSNQGADKLFDYDSTYKWCGSFTSKEEGDTTKGVYVIFKTSLSIIPIHYTMTTADDTRSYPARNWKQWQLYGMDADSDADVTRASENWVPLDKKYDVGTDQLPTTNLTSVEFTLSEENSTAYRYFKIELDKIAGNTYCMQMADFLIEGIFTYIPFADANVKAICVSNWDTDGDGELSMEEVSVVTNLGEIFKNNDSITTFNELQYFKGLSSIDDYAFNGCSSLTSIILPKNVTSIGVHAFDDCSSLISVSIPESVTSIGVHAFDGCSSLTSVILPEGMTAIGENVFNGCSSLTSITIPESVTSIGRQAFDGCTSLPSIAIPERVIAIGEDAFTHCSSLTFVTLPEGMTAIGENIFNGCTSLTSITIPKSVTSIGRHAFDSCTSLTSVTIPESVAEIGEDAFNGCNGLTSVEVKNPTPIVITQNTFSNRTNAILYVPTGCREAYLAADHWNEFKEIVALEDIISFADANVKAICVSKWDTNGDGELSYAEAAAVTSIWFKGNTSIASFNELQNFKGLRTIGESAFNGCTNLSSITIPESVTSIGGSAFEGCTRLSSIIIPDSVKSVGAYAFYGCKSLISVTIGSGVTSLKGGTFYGCSSLESIELPNSLISLEDAPEWRFVNNVGNRGNWGVFSGCSGLTSVIIPSSVTTIGKDAFYGCSSLKMVISKISTPFDVDAFRYFDATLVVPRGTRANYKSVNGWKFSIIIEEGDTSYDREMSDEQGVKYKLKQADDYSFYYSVTGYLYNNLKSEIVIPADLDGCPVRVVGANAFKGCTTLSSITIPNSVTSIERRAFQACVNLTTVILGNQLETIEYYAFYGCTSLSSITIPNSVTDLGEFAFLECTGLTSVTIGTSITSLKAGTFHGCSNLKTVQIPNSVTKMADVSNGYSPYDNSWNPKGIYGVFSGCKGLTSVTIGNGLAYIGSYAFQGCNDLTSVTIPNSVTSIGDYAFYSCSNLISVEVENPIPVAITQNTFNNRENATLNVPSGSGAAYLAADYWKEFKEIVDKGQGIIFADANVKAICVSKWDTNGDGELSYDEAAAVTSLEEVFRDNTSIISFNELQYFKGLIRIGDNTFSGCWKLDSLTIPKSVTSIGNSAFDGCTGLTSVTIPESVTEIGDNSFNGCSSLTSVIIPEGVTSIADSSFKGCNSLKSVIIPESMTSIGNSAFDGCTGLTSVTIPESVTAIGDNAFWNCSSLFYVEVKNPKPVAITHNTFSNCTNAILYVSSGSVSEYKSDTYWDEFKEIVETDGIIPFVSSSVKSICVSKWDTNGDGKLSYAEAAAVTSLGGAFTQRSLGSFNELQYFKGLNSIDSREFYLCSFSSITIPNSVTSIGGSAFAGCSALTSVTIPNSVTSIGGNAFYDCKKLTSITIPNSVTSIGSSAFSGCSGLKMVISEISKPFGVDAFGGSLNNATLVVPMGSRADYKSVSGWRFAFIYEEGETIIEREQTDEIGLFYTLRQADEADDYRVYYAVTGHSDELNTEIVIPSDLGGCPVASIENYVFKNCTSLSAITIPNSVTSIGKDAFDGCSSLASVHISDLESWLKIEFGANPFPAHDLFLNGEKITDLVIPSNVTSIGDYAFYKCSSLTSVNVPNSTIGDYAFYECKNLTSVKTGNGVSSIGDWVFSFCYNLTSVKMGKNVRVIGQYAFHSCHNLASITLPNKLDSIGTGAFQSTSLTFVNIPGNVETIGNYAFNDCRSLASVSFEDGINGIGSGAFAGCAFSSITIPNSVTTIGEKAFQNCRSLTSVMIGSGVTSLESATFQGCSSLLSITIPNSVTSIADGYNYREYRNNRYYYYTSGVFYGCSSLTSVTIGSNVTHLGSYAFIDCSKLSSVKMGENVNSIGDGAFSNCSNLTSIILPNSLESIGNNVFPSSMISIEFPDSFTNIPDNLFCNNNFKYIKLGNNVKSIGVNAFGSSSPVIEIDTSTPPAIASNAFPKVSYLSNINVIVPDAKAEAVYRKAAVWKDMTFSNQDNIAEVTVDMPGDLSWELVDECNMMPAKVVGLKVNGTINAEDFNQMLVNMKSLLRLDLSGCDITEIPDNALMGKTQLQELTLPTKLQVIGKSAFQNCTSLKELILQTGLKIIGQSAFQNCTSLQNLTLQTGLQSIGQSAFQDCTSLQILILQPGLQTIGQNAFQGCTSLTDELDLPSTLTAIGESAFVGTNYTSVKLPSALQTIGDNAFNNLSIAQQLILPKKVTSVGASAFAGTKITGLVIPDGMTSIGDNAFAGTPIQGHVTIPDGVTYLGRGAFRNSQLSTVFLPNSITTLSQGVFQGCPNLDIVYVPDNYTNVESSVFDGCGSLKVVRLSANLTSMGEYALQNTPLEYIKIPLQVEVLPKGVLKNCKSLESLTLSAGLKTVEAEALIGCTALRNLSIEAVDPPVIKERSAINGINTDLCIISIPTQSYRKYVLAEYWGQFVQMRNDIAVETEGNGEIAFEGVEENEEETVDESEVQDLHTPGDTSGLALEEESMPIANNGSTIYVPQQGKVRFYIIPGEGEEVLSATLDGEDIMPYIVDGVYIATADKRNAKLVVKFSNEGQGSVGLLGDVNGDGTVSVTDVGCVINYILEQVPDPFIYAAADMNGDEDISVTDVGCIINYILSDGAASRAAQEAVYSYGYGELQLMKNTDGYVLTLDGADAFIGFQMDVTVPEDAEGCDVRLKETGTGHQLVCRHLGNGHYRMVCYSPTNETFREGLTDLLTIETDGNMTVSNIRFTTKGLNEVRFADMNATPTGIANVTDPKTTDTKVYTLGGQLCPNKLQKGIYVRNGKKVIVK